MFDRAAYTFSIMRASWQVLMKDKEMLLFSLISFICCLAVLASFGIPMYSNDMLAPPEDSADTAGQVIYYGVLFLFYFCNYFVITFFNSAICACTIKRLGGGEPTIGDGFSFAFQALPQIFGWALLAATVGLVLRIIEDKSEKAGRIIAGVLGMAWSLVTFLIVPVLVVEKKGPFASLKRSTGLLKGTWGDQIVGNFSFGLIFFLLNIPGIALIVFGVMSDVNLLLIGVGIFYVLLVALVQSTLQAIFSAVLYSYYETGREPEAFSGLMRSAVVSR